MRRFTFDTIDPARLSSDDLADAFEEFVGEVLRPIHPALKPYSAGGKDGCIDLRARGATQTVVECKVVGADKESSVRGRWLETADRLTRNLAAPAGPPVGQSQYGPWYDRDVPIRHYIFCTTADFKNAGQEDKLTGEVKDFFRTLAERPHLQHLRGMTVEVMDWRDLWLQTSALLQLRWFAPERPAGLLPLESRARGARFREYLDNARIAYHSLSEHLAAHPAPDGVQIRTEAQLLEMLGSPELHGLLISGAGGVGKTRLCKELAWNAHHDGWTVFRAGQTLRSDGLRELAQRLTIGDRVLVLFDYVEAHPAFQEIAEAISDFNEEYGLQIRYVANCRTSYVGAFRVLHAYAHVDLTPSTRSDAQGWLQGYRVATVAHILQSRGLEVYETRCRDIPVFAVFLCWLADHDRSAEFAELLEQDDFGNWVLASIGKSFPGAETERDLALLTAMLPLSARAADALPESRFGPLLDRLAADVWIERVVEVLPGEEVEEQWVAIHDVLVDQVILGHLKRVPHRAPEFVRALLRIAEGAGALRTTIASLQRVGDRAAFADVRWLDVFAASIRAAREPWIGVRSDLLRTSLLSESERVRLLRLGPEFWSGAERDPQFQFSIGWLCKWASKIEPNALDAEGRQLLGEAAVQASAAAERFNFVLTHGLRLAPALRDRALHWLRTHPQELQTHYLLVSWLECTQELEPVRPIVTDWVRTFSRAPQLSYVAAAWLTAGGDPQVLRASLATWQGVHASAEYAQFVYTAWLSCGHDPQFVESSIRDWLKLHASRVDAGFVYKAWLDATRDRTLVEASIRQWLEKHATDNEAQFVYASWLEATHDRSLVEKPLRHWLDVYPLTLEARFVYQSWLDATRDRALVEKPIRAWLEKYATAVEAQYVYRSWLDATADAEVVAAPMQAWIEEHGTIGDANFIYRAWLEATEDFDSVRDPALRWINGHVDDPEAVYLLKFVSMQPDLPVESVRDVLTWCRNFKDLDDTLWRLARVGQQFHKPELAVDAITACEIIFPSTLFEQRGVAPFVRQFVTTLLGRLIANPAARSGELRRRVDLLWREWLCHPEAFGPDLRIPQRYQLPGYVVRVVKMIADGTLRLDEHRDAISRFIAWVNGWDPVQRQEVSRLLELSDA